ncbi:hypothetical protein [Pseudomonas yamanorum]|uniref:hypothetical protein n=1 Tax=Pseudomonas yamanorum TaxID=515393 RepID=UPI002ED5B021|nr:hypothetical protein VYI69_13630 [Pseudomonas yamanorum]
MEKLQVMTQGGWAYVLCAIGKRKVEITEDRRHGLPRNCPDLASQILREFEKDFPDKKFRLA